VLKNIKKEKLCYLSSARKAASIPTNIPGGKISWRECLDKKVVQMMFFVVFEEYCIGFTDRARTAVFIRSPK
jgi:hypothetical protein